MMTVFGSGMGVVENFSRVVCFTIVLTHYVGRQLEIQSSTLLGPILLKKAGL